MSNLVNKIAAKILRATPNNILKKIFKPDTNSDGYELAADAKVTVWFLEKTAKDFSDLPVDEGRKLIDDEAEAGAGPNIMVGSIEDFKIDDIKVRYYRPEGVSKDENLPLLIYLHGGGCVLGSINSHDNTARFLAKNSNIAVLNVDYSLAPENKFPKALLDINSIVDYVINGNLEGVDKDRIAVGGDSAGGNLSAALGLYRAKNNLSQVKLLMLYVPVTNLSDMSTSSYKEFEDGFYLTKKQMIWYKERYLESEEDAKNYLVSPLLAPNDIIKKLPKTYISVAGFDPLRDEGIAFHNLLKSNNIDSTLIINKTLIHPFVNTFYVWRDAEVTMKKSAEFLKNNL